MNGTAEGAGAAGRTPPPEGEEALGQPGVDAEENRAAGGVAEDPRPESAGQAGTREESDAETTTPPPNEEGLPEIGARAEAGDGREADLERARVEEAGESPGTGEACGAGAHAGGRREAALETVAPDEADGPSGGEGTSEPAEAAPGGESQGNSGWTEEGIEGLFRTLDGITDDAAETRSMLEKLTAAHGEGEARAAVEARERMRVHAADFHRAAEGEKRRRWRWWAAAAAAAAPAALLLGILVEQQFQVIPVHDPTGGWRAHVWENYGPTVVDCADEARRTGGEVECRLVVRRP